MPVTMSVAQSVAEFSTAPYTVQRYSLMRHIIPGYKQINMPPDVTLYMLVRSKDLCRNNVFLTISFRRAQCVPIIFGGCFCTILDIQMFWHYLILGCVCMNVL